MNITPYGRNILVVPAKKDQVLLSDMNTDEAYGEVIAIGKDVKEAKVGNIILFTKWGIRDTEIKGDKAFFVKEDDDFFLGVVEL